MYVRNLLCTCLDSCIKEIPGVHKNERSGVHLELIKYILGRLGRAMISLFLILVIVFFLMRLLPVETYYGDRAEKMSEETKQAVLAELGLDDPIRVQLANYLKGLAKLDFGKSLTYYKGKPVFGDRSEDFLLASFWRRIVDFVIIFRT